jgi:uracil-DNA glycosylase family 4
MIVGEAPGGTEEALGRPFVGSSGHLLDAMLSSVGIIRGECRVTNVLKFRPERNDFSTLYFDAKKLKPTPTLEKAQEAVRSEVESLKPQVVIALGGEALVALTAKRGISKWRGSPLERRFGSHTCVVVPTLHPAFILRQYADRAIVELDLKKALRISREGFVKPTFNFELNPPFERTMEFLSSRPPCVSVDIESVGTLVRCVGFATSARDAICVPLISRLGGSKREPSTFIEFEPVGPSNSHWSLEEEAEVLKALDGFLGDPNVKKRLQNFPYDATMLEKQFGFRVRGLEIDTMVAHHVAYSELAKGLDFLASLHTDVEYYSDYNASDDFSTWNYNCLDCAVTFEIADVLIKELKALNLWEFYKNHVEPTMLSLTKAQNVGVLVNVELREKIRTITTIALKEDEAKLGKLVGESTFNPNSPKQVGELLYQKLGMPPQVHRKRRNVTTDEKALEYLCNKFPLHEPTIRAILDCRQRGKLISTLLSAELTSSGRFLTSYNVSGTVNGRISASTTITGEGGNIQQTERGPMRRMFVPDSASDVFIKVDLSQAENRFVMWDAHVERIISRYVNDPTFDVHRWNAAENIFHVNESEVTKEMRNIAKAGVHGGNYHLGHRTAAAIYKMSVADAKRALEGYQNALPELNAWWERIQQEVLRSRVLTSPLGRRRMFFGRVDDDMFRSAYAFRPQSHVGDLINRAFALATLVLKAERCEPRIQMHDEIVFNCPKESLSEALPKIKALLEIPTFFEGISDPLIIPGDFAVGDSWFDVEPVEVKL